MLTITVALHELKKLLFLNVNFSRFSNFSLCMMRLGQQQANCDNRAKSVGEAQNPAVPITDSSGMSWYVTIEPRTLSGIRIENENENVAHVT